MPAFNEIWENFLAGKLSEEQTIAFRQYLLTEEIEVEEAITELVNDQAIAGLGSPEQGQYILSRVLGRINEQVPVRRINWYKRIAVAAAILLIISTGSYFWMNDKKEKSRQERTIAKGIAPPDKTKAYISLADGRIIYIDSMDSGTITNADNVAVVKTADGKIIYKGNTDELIYNTLNNPRGSKVIDMQFSDGSHIWLNAGSSVTYPVTFAGKERKVAITGEAYFEITHNEEKPFVVSKGDAAIRVLGTHFNVNAYDDEEYMKVTLLEGAVKVSKGGESKILAPGQQAQLSDRIKIISGADIEKVMAWKNGLFSYDGDNLETIMREVSRWYDVEVVFEDNIDEKFHAEINRNTNVLTLIKMLEKTNAVKFIIGGKKITVKK